MLFDKNVERIRELKRQDPLGSAARIAELTARGPEWWVQYRDKDNRRRSEKCPPEYKGKAGASQFYSIRVSEVLRGVHDSVDVRRVKIPTVTAAYLEERMAGRSSISSAKGLVKHIDKHMGHWRLDRIDERPGLLVDLFKHFPEPGLSQKTIWNIFITLRAAINHWIRYRRLHMKNPCDLINLEPNTRVMEFVPTQEDYERIVATALVEGVRQDAINLIGAVRYSGLRVGEVLAWQVQDVCLAPADGSFPYFWAIISKQKARTRVAIPMVRQLHEILKAQIGGRSAGSVWPWTRPPYRLLKVYELEKKPTKDGKVREVRIFKGDLYKLAGVSVPRPFHDFRKTVKLDLVKMGVSREIRKAFQGHATDSMDDYYTHFRRFDLEKAVSESYNNQTYNQKEKGRSFDRP